MGLFEFLAKFWYLWVLVLLLAVYRLILPVIKGWFGEKTISLYLRALSQAEYTVLGDLIGMFIGDTLQIYLTFYKELFYAEENL